MNELKKRLSGLKSQDNSLEIVKFSDLSEIQGGDCPSLTSCGNYVDCATKYKSGNRDLDIDATIPILKP